MCAAISPTQALYLMADLQIFHLIIVVEVEGFGQKGSVYEPLKSGVMGRAGSGQSYSDFSDKLWKNPLRSLITQMLPY